MGFKRALTPWARNHVRTPGEECNRVINISSFGAKEPSQPTIQPHRFQLHIAGVSTCAAFGITLTCFVLLNIEKMRMQIQGFVVRWKCLLFDINRSNVVPCLLHLLDGGRICCSAMLLPTERNTPHAISDCKWTPNTFSSPNKVQYCSLCALGIDAALLVLVIFKWPLGKIATCSKGEQLTKQMPQQQMQQQQVKERNI